MKECRDIEMDLGAFAGDELDSGSRATVLAHLDRCAPCREELARERHMRRTLGEMPTVSAPPELDARIKAALTVKSTATQFAWNRGRLTAAVLLAAASLAVALFVPGLLNAPAPEFSEQEIAAGRQDVMYTLALTAKIIDHTRKDTMVDVFADKLPQAISDSFKMTKSNNSGGNG